jgi:hypothetical protein
MKVRLAILDDYQNVAPEMADWSSVADKATLTIFNDHLNDIDEIVNRLAPFDVVCVMRERTLLTREILALRMRRARSRFTFMTTARTFFRRSAS